jgi:Xaa-Pro aminopeptidase
VSAADARGPHEPAEARLQRLRELLGHERLDALFVSALIDVRYLTGFTGSSGAAVVRGSGGSEDDVFLTDFRYTTQSSEQVSSLYRREILGGEIIDGLAPLLGEGPGRLGFDDTSTTVAGLGRLREALPAGWELVPSAGLVQKLRLIKDAGEVERLRASSQLADEALRGVLEDGIVGRSERDVAIDLELRMRRLGAEAPSFSSIVAAGPHASLPHAQPRDQPIPRDVLVTIDWGALHEGYCSDCTRTYATGEGVSGQAREIYELVLAAQLKGLEAVRPGPNGREVDAQAREVIEAGGEGEHFGHGLGHGVGMEIHEGPRLSRNASTAPLQAGNVVTVEPGIYLPGVLGVRIEDLVVVEEQGNAVLTSLPKDLTIVS